MKITVCFGDTNVIVPCGNGDLKVNDFIENSILRYKKATHKPIDALIRVYKLKTKRDGGILDPDDVLRDVVEDKELLIAIFDEYNSHNSNDDDTSIQTTTTISNNTNTDKHLFIQLNDNDDSQPSQQQYHYQYQMDDEDQDQENSRHHDSKSINKYTANSFKLKSGSESCLFKMETSNNNNNNGNGSVKRQSMGKDGRAQFLLTTQPLIDHDVNTNSNWTMSRVEHRRTMNDRLTNSLRYQRDDNQNVFNRFSSNRQSKLNNNNNNGHDQQPAPIQKSIETATHIFRFSRICGPLGIHVIPTYDPTSKKDMGLLIQRIEQNGRIFKDGRLKTGDLIVEINGKSLVGVDFISAQEVLRESMKEIDLDFKIIRELNKPQQQSNGHVEQQLDEEYAHDYANLNLNESQTDNNSSNDYYLNEDLNEPADAESSTSKQQQQQVSPLYSKSNNLNSLNTKKIGKKIHVQLIKGPQGLGFKLASRDNITSGEISPIYVKNILPKGAAITDGRLQRGDRLLEVNGMDMTVKTLNEAVNILRNTKLGTLVDIVVSRQTQAFPRELPQEEPESQSNSERTYSSCTESHRELLTFEIALNDTGSAGLGVSVKGKTKKIEEPDSDLPQSIDLGIFVKTVINGGAASKDGRLKPNDQLININGFSLLGKSNEEAMQILREAMLVETKPGFIQLTISRKIRVEASSQFENSINTEADVEVLSQEPFKTPSKSPSKKSINKFSQIGSENGSHNGDYTDSNDTEPSSEMSKRTFSRDAPTRRSMSEKRKMYNSDRSNEFYTKIKINKLLDVPNKSDDFVRIGSFESVVKSDANKNPTKNTIDATPQKVKTNLIKVQQDSPNHKQNVQSLKQTYLQHIEPSSGPATVTSKPSTPTILTKSTSNQNKLNNLIKTFQTTTAQTNLKKSTKSNSIESIPSMLSYRNGKSNSAANKDPTHLSYHPQLTQNGNLNKNSSNGYGPTNHQLTQLQQHQQGTSSNSSSGGGGGGGGGVGISSSNNNNDNLPLANIVNRQRTINRSFRTAVDKSFDVPNSDSFEDFYANRMHNLRMSSQSDDIRNKNKKSKKGIIETFQNLFKSTNKRNEQKYNVELLGFQKSLETDNKQHIKDLQENYLNSIKKFSVKDDTNRTQQTGTHQSISNKIVNENWVGNNLSNSSKSSNSASRDSPSRRGMVMNGNEVIITTNGNMVITPSPPPQQHPQPSQVNENERFIEDSTVMSTHENGYKFMNRRDMMFYSSMDNYQQSNHHHHHHHQPQQQQQQPKINGIKPSTVQQCADSSRPNSAMAYIDLNNKNKIINNNLYFKTILQQQQQHKQLPNQQTKHEFHSTSDNFFNKTQPPNGGTAQPTTTTQPANNNNNNTFEMLSLPRPAQV